MRIVPFNDRFLDRAALMWFASMRNGVPFLQPVHSYEQMLVFLRDVVVPQNEVYVALEVEEVRGFVAVAEDYLNQLYVAVAAQRRGVGSTLLAKALERSPTRILSHPFQRSRPARAFYAKYGFKDMAFGLCAEYNDQLDVDILWKPSALA